MTSPAIALTPSATPAQRRRWFYAAYLECGLRPAQARKAQRANIARGRVIAAGLVGLGGRRRG